MMPGWAVRPEETAAQILARAVSEAHAEADRVGRQRAREARSRMNRAERRARDREQRS